MRRFLYLTTALALAVPAFAQSANPPAPAAAAGYNTRTFGPGVTVGADWQRFGFFGVDPSSTNVTQNADGSVTIAGGGNGYNAQLSSAAPASNAQAWDGVAFGGGGYFEATVSWEGDYNGWGTPGSNGWPAFWSNDIERMSGGGTDHGIEVDFMEAWGNDRWGAALHDWYGTSGQQFVQGSEQTTPEGVTASQPHKYGMLWVPATANSRGYVKFYFDGNNLKDLDFSWDRGDPNNPAVPKDFSALDGLHLALILGSGSGNPMTVYSVEVWQKSAASNVGSRSGQTASQASPGAQDVNATNERQKIDAEIASSTSDISALEARVAESIARSGSSSASSAGTPTASSPQLSPASPTAATVTPPIAFPSGQQSLQQELVTIRREQATVEQQIRAISAQIAGTARD